MDYAREKGIVNTYYNYSRPATRDITYMAEVRLLSGAGVINGIQESGKTYFKPLNTITRAEVATVVGRMARPESRIGK